METLEDVKKQAPASVDTKYLEFKQAIKKLKISLFLDLRDKIKELHAKVPEYKLEIDDWLEKIHWDVRWTWKETNFNYNKDLKETIETLLERQENFDRSKHCPSHQDFDESCAGCRRKGKLRIGKAFFDACDRDNELKRVIEDILRRNALPVDIFDKCALEGADALIYRLLFIRMYEDNTGESCLGKDFVNHLEMLSSLAAVDGRSQGIFDEISVLFKKIYNAPLFDEPYLAAIEWNPALVIAVITELQRFKFNEFDIDFVGRLYEENLERDIRNSLGTFYTPRPIIRYIMRSLDLDKFLGDLQNPAIIIKPRVLDPACGSGGFLTQFYDCMKEKMKVEGWDDRRIFTTLSSQIYGLDIDNYAVQLCSMNLLLKTSFENIKDARLNVYQADAVRAIFNDDASLPASLRNATSIAGDESKRMLDLPGKEFAGMRFRFIVSNPPFFEIEKFDAFPHLYPALQHDSKPNIASLFLERFLTFLEDDGILVFVFPASILFSDSYIAIRTEIVDNYKILKIVQLGRAFSDVGLEQVILMVQKVTDRDGLATNKVQFLHEDASMPTLTFNASEALQQHFQEDRKKRLRVFLDDEVLPIIKKIENPARTAFLGDNCMEHVAKTGENAVAIFRGMGWERKKKTSKSATCSTRAIKGTNIMRYGIKGTYYVDDEAARNRKKSRSTHQECIASRTLELMKTRDKIVIQRLVSSRTRLVAASDTTRIITLSTILNAFLRDDAPWDLDFVVAVLNSEFMTYYVIDHVFMHARLSTSIDANYARYLPIPLAGIKQQQQVVNLVNEIKEIVAASIRLGKEFPEIENQESYVEKELLINREIYSLYQLTDKEIAIIKRRIQEFHESESE